MKIEAKTIIRKGFKNTFYKLDDEHFYESMIPQIFGVNDQLSNFPNIPGDAEFIHICITDDNSNHVNIVPLIEDQLDSLSDHLTKRELNIYKSAYDWTINEIIKP